MGREQTYGARAVHGTLKLRQVVRTREGLLKSCRAKLASDLSVNVGDEQTRTTEWSLLHDGRVAELLNESLTTLDGGVGDLSSLGRSITNPATTLELVDEGDHTMDVGEVDEGITNVACRLEVDAQVHEVVGTEASIVEDSLESHL